MSIAVAGLADLFVRAGLDDKRYGVEARAFCSEQGAINVCEVLEDDELLRAFVDRLQLKRLEQRRCETAAADFRAGNWRPEAKAEDSGASVGYQKVDATTIHSIGKTQEPEVSKGVASVNDGRPDRLFRAGASWRGRGTSRVGKGGGVVSATQSRNHYFDQAADLEEYCGSGGGHYFKSQELALSPVSDDQHYFREPEPSQPKAKSTKMPLFCGSCGNAFDGPEKFCQQCGVARVIDFPKEVSASQHLPREIRAHPSTSGKQKAFRSDRSEPSSHYFVEDTAEPESVHSRAPLRNNSSNDNTSSAAQRKHQSGPQSRPQRPKDIGQREVLENSRESVLGTLEEKRRQEEEAKDAKREAARQRRRQQDAERASERRIDPEDGKAYTLDEFRTHHASAFSQSEIDKYWNSECRVQTTEAPKPQQTSQRRLDPEDDCLYTLAEILQRHAGSFSEDEIRAYWRDECLVISDKVERW